MAAVRSCLPSNMPVLGSLLVCLLCSQHIVQGLTTLSITLSNKTGLHGKGYIIAAYVQTQRYPQLDRSHTL